MSHDRVGVTIQIYSWWRSGTGAGRAAQLDTICTRDRSGLPYLPGRHLRGLFRDAVRRMEAWDLESWNGVEQALFGEWGFRPPENAIAAPVPYRGAHRGALAVTDACMSPAERVAFEQDAEQAAMDGHRPLSDDLFATLRSTSMEDGVAVPHSLRSEEVAVPMQLSATVDFLGYDDAAQWRGSWKGALAAAAPLIRAVGAKRMRGLGRASVLIEENDR